MDKLLTTKERKMQVRNGRIVDAYKRLREKQDASVSDNRIFINIADNEGLSVTHIRNIINKYKDGNA